MLALVGCGGGGEEAKKPDKKDGETKGHTNSSKAAKVAAKEAGLKVTVPKGYWYEDTLEQTKPKQSFGIYSEEANQRILCILFDDMVPVENLNAYVAAPPFLGLERRSEVDKGNRKFGEVSLQWTLGDYVKKKKRHDGEFKGTDFLVTEDAKPAQKVMLASFPALEDKKSVLAIAVAYDQNKELEHETSIFIIGSLIEKGKLGTKKRTNPGAEAEQQKVNHFLADAKQAIDEKLSLPKEILKTAEAYKDEHDRPKKWRGNRIFVVLDGSGNIVQKTFKTEIPSIEYEDINNAIEEAIKKAKPFKDPPIGKDGKFYMKVRLLGTETYCTKANEKDLKKLDQ